MKKRPTTTMASVVLSLCLASAAPAFAADADKHDHGKPDTNNSQQADHGDRADRGDRHEQTPAKPATTPTPTVTQNSRNNVLNTTRQDSANRAAILKNQQDNARKQEDARRTATPQNTPSRTVIENNRAPNNPVTSQTSRSDRSARSDRNRVDVSQYRRNENSPKRYRAPAYHGPRGYHYRHYSYGDRLPASYYGRDYWLSDFLIYGLFPPPDGYVWVRYGPDALLIDEYTGEIVQVRYNAFY